jgi:nucleoside-diphosphate-sugar epimerase
VLDIVQANMLAMESKHAVGERFNVATTNHITILKLLEILKTITKTKDVEHKFGPSRTGDLRFGVASIDKIRNSLGYVPKISIDKGLEGVVEFFRTTQPQLLHV